MHILGTAMGSKTGSVARMLWNMWNIVSSECKQQVSWTPTPPIHFKFSIAVEHVPHSVNVQLLGCVEQAV